MSSLFAAKDYLFPKRQPFLPPEEGEFQYPPPPPPPQPGGTRPAFSAQGGGQPFGGGSNFFPAGGSTGEGPPEPPVTVLAPPGAIPGQVISLGGWDFLVHPDPTSAYNPKALPLMTRLGRTAVPGAPKFHYAYGQTGMLKVNDATGEQTLIPYPPGFKEPPKTVKVKYGTAEVRSPDGTEIWTVQTADGQPIEDEFGHYGRVLSRRPVSALTEYERRQLQFHEAELARLKLNDAERRQRETAAAQLARQRYIDERARQSSIDSANFAEAQRGIATGRFDLQKTVQDYAAAMRQKAINQELYGSPDIPGRAAKPWWYYLPGGPELEQRLQRQRSLNLTVPAGVANARWDPNLNKFVTTYGQEVPGGQVEPVPERTPSYGVNPLAPNPFTDHPLYGGLGIEPGMPLTGEQRDAVRTRQINMAARGKYIADQAEAERKAREERENLLGRQALASILQARRPFEQR